MLSGSVGYSTECSEGISDTLVEGVGEVLPYRFKPERCSGTYSESKEEAEVVIVSSREE